MKMPVQIRKIRWLLLTGVLLMLLGGGMERYNRLHPPLKKAAAILKDYIVEHEREIDGIFNDTSFVNHIDSVPLIYQYFAKHPTDENCELLIYNKDRQLVYWSDNKMIPTNPDRIIRRDLKYVKLGSGYHIVKRKSFANGHEAIALMTIYHNYQVSNKYLENGFVLNKPLLRRVTVSNKDDSESAPEVAISNTKNEYLFSIRKNNLNTYAGNPIFLFLEILGFILIFAAVNSWVRWQLIQHQYIKAVVLTACYIIATETVMFLQLPAFSIENIIFSPKLYASPFWGDNLGVLLMRIFFAHWILHLTLRYLIQYLKPDSKARSIVLSLVLTFAFYSLLYIIASLHSNSVISFEFYNFNSLDFNSFLAMIVVGVAFGMLYMAGKYIRFEDFNRTFYITMLPIHLAGMFVAWKFEMLNDVSVIAFCVAWLFLYIRYLRFLINRQDVLKRHRFISNLIMLAMFALLGSVVMLHFAGIRAEEVAERKAVELASERDMGEEFDFSYISSRISEDNFIKNYFSSPFMSNFDLENRVLYKYFKNFTNKYNIVTYAFNKEGYVLRGEAAKTLEELQFMRKQRGSQPISPYFYYLSVKPKGEKYLAVYDIQQDSLTVGYLFLEFIPKVFSAYSAYPELLNKDISPEMDDTDESSYGIFRNKLLITHMGKFPYAQYLEFARPEDGQQSVIYKNGYRHVIFSTGEKTVVVTSKNRTLMNTLSVFSYMLLFLLFFFIVTDLAMIHRNFWGEYSLQQLFRPNTLQKQIQSSMISLVLFSLAMIGIVTFLYFSIQYNNFHNNKLISRADAILQTLEQFYKDAIPKYGNKAFEVSVQQRLKVLSEIYAIDLNVYNKQGVLMMATQPEIFKRNLISDRMNSEAYRELSIMRRSQFTHDEKIGKLEYLSAYMPVVDVNNKVLGYINFPYYGKQRSIRNDVSYFMVALVNVYVLLILGAAVAAVLLSKSITNPLAIITQNLKNISLNNKNNPIVWQNKDEIGLLVEEYNRMISELEESAGRLARSEREGAWREMAKQVAHEIKNPLTPMKLSIQYLQNALRSNRDDIQELTAKTAERLIEQIDSLSRIATAFSDFAKMPLGNHSPFDLKVLTESTASLFMAENVDIQINVPLDKCVVFADKEQMMRVLINLIKNAMQAYPEGIRGKVYLDLISKGNNYLLSIKDEGSGIEAAKISNVFEPYFTTKNSGTGLGLAMSKSIVEKANGTIYFETEWNKGTTFYIELPKWSERDET